MIKKYEQYIKEELDWKTMNSASKKLKDIGHTNRARAISKHSVFHSTKMEWINNYYDMADDSIERSDFNDIFLPIYIYTTIGINNINYNLINNHKPKFTFEQSYSGLIPSFIRNMLFSEVKYEDKYGLKLAINSFNVFTCFGPYFYDFGFFGVAWHSLFLGIIASRYRINRIRNLFDTVSFSAISFAILASPFWDFLMNWFFLGTLIVCSYYSKKYHQNAC